MFVSSKGKYLKGEKEINIEDYVLTYMNQMKVHAMDKPVTLTLYGHIGKKENSSVIFIYGAALIRETEKETEKDIWQKFFSDYDIIGRVKIDGNGRENTNYSIFYETNESMQDYLLYYNKCDIQILKKDTVILPPGIRYYNSKRNENNLWVKLKMLLMGMLCFLMAIAVSAVNDYSKLYQFVEMFEKAILFME